MYRINLHYRSCDRITCLFFPFFFSHFSSLSLHAVDSASSAAAEDPVSVAVYIDSWQPIIGLSSTYCIGPSLQGARNSTLHDSCSPQPI